MEKKHQIITKLLFLICPNAYFNKDNSPTPFYLTSVLGCLSQIAPVIKQMISDRLVSLIKANKKMPQVIIIVNTFLR